MGVVSQKDSQDPGLAHSLLPATNTMSATIVVSIITGVGKSVTLPSDPICTKRAIKREAGGQKESVSFGLVCTTGRFESSEDVTMRIPRVPGARIGALTTKEVLTKNTVSDHEDMQKENNQIRKEREIDSLLKITLQPQGLN